LAITFEPEMLESQPTPLKTRRSIWFPIKFKSKELALDVDAQGLIILSKHGQTYSHYDVTNKATNVWNFPIFLFKVKLQDFPHL